MSLCLYYVFLTLTFNISVCLFFKLRFVNFSINEYCIVGYNVCNKASMPMFTSPMGVVTVRRIVMSVSVYLSVRSLSRKPHSRTSSNFLCMLILAVAMSFSNSAAICYLLPV